MAHMQQHYAQGETQQKVITWRTTDEVIDTSRECRWRCFVCRWSCQAVRSRQSPLHADIHTYIQTAWVHCRQTFTHTYRLHAVNVSSRFTKHTVTKPPVCYECWETETSVQIMMETVVGGWRRWALLSPDGVAPSWMVGVSASVNLPLRHKVQKFASGTGSPGWSRKKGRETVVVDGNRQTNMSDHEECWVTSFGSSG